MLLTSTKAGGDLPLPHPLEKFICGQESALNWQGLILLCVFLINIHTVFQLHLRQQVKETPFALGKNIRSLLSEKLQP